MREVFVHLNQMVEQGVIDDYAIGGSVGYMIYVEPFATEDIDVFVLLPQSSLLISLAPIYAYAEGHGFDLDHEHIIIGGEKVQFVVAPTQLEENAIENAQQHRLLGQIVRVMSPEYLVATSLRAGRFKDFAKVEKMLEQYSSLDFALLDKLIDEFDLRNAWDKVNTEVTVDAAYAIFTAGKKAWRRKQAAQPFIFKLASLQKLRNRTLG